jgi:hypothetical protein
MKVYQAISAVQGALAQTGISKDRQATGGASYRFRGIDDVYSALAPLLKDHGLCIIPRMLSRQCDERKSAKGGALFYTTVHAEFDFVSAEDGTKHTAATFGEAMDSSDKSTNKAMSAAYKYAAFMTFCIPVEADNDTENDHHEVAPVETVQFISDAQWALLVTTIELAQADTMTVCRAAKATSLKEISAAKFEAIMKRLNDKIADQIAAEDAAYNAPFSGDQDTQF